MDALPLTFFSSLLLPFATPAYCKGCACKNCHNTPAHEDKRRQAIDRIIERNPDAFNKPVAGGSQRKCHCKRSQCLKKYCECFQAGLPCLPECSCISCKNFEGSDLRSRAIAGEDLNLRPATRDLEGDGEDLGPRVRPVRRAAARRKVIQDFESSDGVAGGTSGGGEGGDSEVGMEDVALFEELERAAGVRADPFDNAAVRPNALPIKLPAGHTRSLENQLIRWDLCNFIQSSLGPFANMVLVGMEVNEKKERDKSPDDVKQEEKQPVPDTPQKTFDLRTQESMPESSLSAVQEKFMLEESAAFLKKILLATESSIVRLGGNPKSIRPQ